ncbi:MAG: Ig-like domain-containing protein, partial [Cyanobacteria bacterium J06607_6]
MTSPTSTQLKGDRPTDQALVILDASVDYLPQLLADLSSVDWLVLDASADGITQITAALQARQSVSSLHIVSHGTAGGLQLGSSQLSLATISHYTQQLQTWATVLQGRDILLYGCQVAQGALGQLFLQQLHQLTGANLAASAQRVGQTADQTNWMLETQLGQVKTPLIFSETLQASYPGHFETVNFSVSTNTLIESEGTPFSFNFTVDGPIPPGGSVVRFEADRPNAISQWNLFALEFTGLAGQPVDVSPNLDFSAFEVTIIAPTASVSLPVFNDFTPEGPDVYTWTASAVSPGTTVNPVGSTTTTIFDDPSQVAPPPPPANTAPVADSDSYATDFDTALTIDAGNGVLNGDTDADGDALTAALISGPSSGSVTLNSDGSFTYTPNAGFSGDDSFTYQANDGTDDSSPATVTVSVGAPPALPEVSLTSDITTLVEDEGTEVTFTISLSEPPPASGLLVDIGTGETFALGDFDIFAPPPQASATGGQLVGGFPDNSGFTFAVLEQTATVTLPVFDDPDRTEDGTVTDPDGPLRNDDIGEEQMTFSVLPREGYTISSGASSVTLTLRDTNAPPPPENTAPVADDDSYSTAFATPLTVDASSGVLDGDTDADGDTLTAAIATDPTGGTVALSDDGSFTYTPNAGFSGDDSFTYTVSDGEGGTDTATVTVTVGDEPPPENTAPVADDDSYTTAFATPLTVDAASGVLDGDTDADGDALTAAIATDPTGGTVALSDDGSFTYTPNAGFSGDDSFTYTVSDGEGGTDTATVSVTVGDEPPLRLKVSVVTVPASSTSAVGL